MNDEEIIKLFNERSEDAIDSLSEKYGRLCLSLAERITNSPQDAEECVNEAYLAAWDNIPPEHPRPLSAYICRLTRNIALNRYKREHSKKRAGNFAECLEELENSVFVNDPIDEKLSEKELAGHINEFVRDLDEIDRMLFVRRFWYVDTYEELSERTGIREGTVRVRISRVKKKLNEYLEKKGVTV